MTTVRGFWSVSDAIMLPEQKMKEEGNVASYLGYHNCRASMD